MSTVRINFVHVVSRASRSDATDATSVSRRLTGRPRAPEKTGWVCDLRAAREARPGEPPETPDFGAPPGPPFWGVPGGPKSGSGGPGVAHFRGYLITLPVGTDFSPVSAGSRTKNMPKKRHFWNFQFFPKIPDFRHFRAPRDRFFRAPKNPLFWAQNRPFLGGPRDPPENPPFWTPPGPPRDPPGAARTGTIFRLYF